MYALHESNTLSPNCTKTLNNLSQWLRLLLHSRSCTCLATLAGLAGAEAIDKRGLSVKLPTTTRIPGNFVEYRKDLKPQVFFSVKVIKFETYYRDP